MINFVWANGENLIILKNVLRKVYVKKINKEKVKNK